MIINFQAVQDTLIALVSVVGIALVFAIAIVGASALVQRDKARHARTGTPVPVTAGIAQHATQTDDARELVLR
jgi:hypothetical protein